MQERLRYPLSRHPRLVAGSAVGAILLLGVAVGLAIGAFGPRLTADASPVPTTSSSGPSGSPAPDASASASATPDQTTAPAWIATGSMAQVRAGHTATLLSDGKVLVVGGDANDGSGPLTSAELYGPGSGTWTATGSTNEGRYAHTATVMPDGKVLVAGGYGSIGPLSSAELYDPSIGSWTATASMSEARAYQTATLLRDGTVLVAGGSFSLSGAPLASAERYDPSSGIWTAAGHMDGVRAGHTATLLSDGRVLVAGGFSSGEGAGASGPAPLASAELYDPSNGSWNATGNMIEAGALYTATLLLDGRVLVAGGIINGQGLASAELYDPRSGSWTATGSMVDGRFDHSATLLLDGRVLVAGGVLSSGGPMMLISAELYDSENGSWTATASMIEARSGHTATLLLDGEVLVAGDLGGAGPLRSAELYNPGSGT